MTSVTREGAANQCQAFSRWKSPYCIMGNVGSTGFGVLPALETKNQD